jgi:hypothetical protein
MVLQLSSSHSSYTVGHGDARERLQATGYKPDVAVQRLRAKCLPETGVRKIRVACSL